MISAAQLPRLALRFRGERYGTGPGRTSTTSGYKDCSGLCVAALALSGVRACGTVSTTLETCSCGGRCYGAPRRCVPLSVARVKPGYAVAIWGVGPDGHIGITMGGGLVVETPSIEGRRVGVSPFGRNVWGEAFEFDGVNYGAVQPLPKEDEMQGAFFAKRGDPRVWYVFGNSKSYVAHPDVMAALAFLGHAVSAKVGVLEPAKARWLDVLPIVPAGAMGGGVVPAQVADELARRLSS